MRSAPDGGRGVGRGFNGVEVIMVQNMTFATCTAVDSFSGSVKTMPAFHWSLKGFFSSRFVSADPGRQRRDPYESNGSLVPVSMRSKPLESLQ